MGIGLLLLSVIYFFKYSIDQGWLTEWVRLVIGLGSGIALVVLGFKGATKGEPLGTVLAGGGIATFFITGFAGHQWFELVSYPVAFGGLVVASALGIFLALRSGAQTLAIVGLIGALATPLLLTSPNPEIAGLALYVSLIVASVAGIYFARAWRALFNIAVVTAWVVLMPAVDQDERPGRPEAAGWDSQTPRQGSGKSSRIAPEAWTTSHQRRVVFPDFPWDSGPHQGWEGTCREAAQKARRRRCPGPRW